MPQRGTKRQLFALVVIGSIAGGCGHNASLIHDTAHGAVATFPVQSDADILSSVGRRDALRLMQEKCPQGWRIVKEGEIPKVSQTADRLWRGQMGTDRIWGIQFTCEQ
jgi:hypothetical protein